MKKLKMFTIPQLQKEKSKWDKLTSFLRKIILFTSECDSEALCLSKNYAEFLQCRSSKSSLLLITLVALKEEKSF